MSHSERYHGNGMCPDDCLIAQAVAGLSVGLLLINNGGRVLWLNRAAEQLLGSPADELIGSSMQDALRDPQLAAFWDDVSETSGGAMADVSLRWPEERELKVNATDCLDPAGKPIGKAILMCDVTSEREVQVKLSQAVARRLLDLTSGHMPPEPVKGLTHQELRILRLVGRGLGNEEIGGQINISASTVRSHLKSLYRKLGLNSRTEAVSFAVRNHLV